MEQKRKPNFHKIWIPVPVRMRDALRRSFFESSVIVSFAEGVLGWLADELDTPYFALLGLAIRLDSPMQGAAFAGGWGSSMVDIDFLTLQLETDVHGHERLSLNPASFPTRPRSVRKSQPPPNSRKVSRTRILCFL